MQLWRRTIYAIIEMNSLRPAMDESSLVEEHNFGRAFSYTYLRSLDMHYIAEMQCLYYQRLNEHSV